MEAAATQLVLPTTYFKEIMYLLTAIIRELFLFIENTVCNVQYGRDKVLVL